MTAPEKSQEKDQQATKDQSPKKEDLAKQIPTVTPEHDNLEPVPDPQIKEEN